MALDMMILNTTTDSFDTLTTSVYTDTLSQSFNQSSDQSLSQSLSQSPDQSLNQLLNVFNDESSTVLMNKSLNQSDDQLENHLVNQLVNHSSNQPMNFNYSFEQNEYLSEFSASTSDMATEQFEASTILTSEIYTNEITDMIVRTSNVLTGHYQDVTISLHNTSTDLLESNITSAMQEGPQWLTLLFGTSPVTLVDVITAVILASIILAIIIGNVLVIVSVLCFTKMRTLSNGLIASLASADLLVSLVVLPISLHHELAGPTWTLGPHVCDLWITSDIFCCTASILNIVVIAIDRYWLITKNVRYTHSPCMPRRQVCVILLGGAWTLSALISTLPLMGWRTGDEKLNPSLCVISQDYAYTVFSTFGAFWFPLLIILIMYFKIFFFARRRAIRRSKNLRPFSTVVSTHRTTSKLPLNRSPSQDVTHCTSPLSILTTPPPLITEEPVKPGLFLLPPPVLPRAPHLRSTSSTSNCSSRGGRERSESDATPPESTIANHPSLHVPSPDSKLPADSRSRKYRSRRMRRSARMLGLIIGGFIICWMPFFMVATVAPFCGETCDIPRKMVSFITWLGYSNSLLNPAIYAIWDKSFRKSFKRLCLCDFWSR